MTDPQPHSAQWFTDARDHWWNPQQLASLSTRWNLRSAHQILDIGCGVGHWGRALAPHLSPEATVLGVDPEPLWIAEATKRAVAIGLAPRFSFQLGALPKLEFPSESFDLVTCQTVLMHQQDPFAALEELVRVLRPGGRIVAAEPDNSSGSILDPAYVDAEIDEQIRYTRMRLQCEQGKRFLGEGDNCLGRKMPALLHRAGLSDIEAFLCERVLTVIPPYDSPAQQAAIADMRSECEKGSWLWGRDKTRKYYLAGGGIFELFDWLYEEGLARERALLARIDRGEAAVVMGHSHYVFSARKRG